VLEGTGALLLSLLVSEAGAVVTVLKVEGGNVNNALPLPEDVKFGFSVLDQVKLGVSEVEIVAVSLAVMVMETISLVVLTTSEVEDSENGGRGWLVMEKSLSVVLLDSEVVVALSVMDSSGAEVVEDSAGVEVMDSSGAEVVDELAGLSVKLGIVNSLLEDLTGLSVTELGVDVTEADEP
jgi:hypothetical protein